MRTLRRAQFSALAFGLATLAIAGCTTGSGERRLPPPEIDGGPRIDAPVDAFVPPPDTGPPMCTAEQMLCGALCIDPMTNSANCGGCGNACEMGDRCEMGSCILACDVGMDPCDVAGTETCVDLQTDTANCGRCGTRCAPGIGCIAGRCSCPMGLRSCAGECVDTMTDVDHCGMCGNGCGTGGTCAGGMCTMCGTDRTTCAGRCIDTDADPRNCGGCARSCDPGESCTGGLCSCEAPRVDCGTGCSDPMTDPMHCGDCTTDCGAGGVCMAGTCTCALGLTMCGTSCANLMTDARHCGSCAMACPMGEVCIMGGCTDAPPTRYMQTAPTAAEVPFIDVCSMPGHMTFLPSEDDASTSVTMPFPFRYWATDLPMGQRMNIATNGWIGMDGLMDESLGGIVPDPDTPNAVIAPHWADLYMRSGICVMTVGTAPLRQFVVQWDDSYYCCGDPGTDPSHLDFEIILSEGSATIDFVYQTMTAAETGTMGLENQTGMMGINACPGGAGECTPTTGQRVRFVPIP